MIQTFLNSEETNIYIYTNLFYNMNLVSQDIKNYINTFFTFKNIYYESVNKVFNLKDYNVIHVRCTDDNMNNDFYDDYLFTEIIKLQLPSNTIVISNNYILKRKINKLFGFYFIDSRAFHTANVNYENELDSTIIEYIILSKSSNTYCFSYYHHGSGFSEQCSVLNNVPYTVVYLPIINFNTDDIRLLINYYSNLLENNFITKLSTRVYNNLDNNNISFITLTNTGCIHYTLNCIESLKRINIKQQLKVYCIGDTGYNALIKQNICCELIDDSAAEKLEEFRKNNWSNVVYHKLKIIYDNLLNNKYVCITDGDIIYENNSIFDYLLDNIDENDLLIQSEGIWNNSVCSGFMFIKSNETTLSIFNPANIEQYRNNVEWDDQVYINEIKFKLKFKMLPLTLFPTGQYYYEYSEKLQPYLIHFNWIVGNEKKNKMIQYNKWYTKK